MRSRRLPATDRRGARTGREVQERGSRERESALGHVLGERDEGRVCPGVMSGGSPSEMMKGEVVWDGRGQVRWQGRAAQEQVVVRWRRQAAGGTRVRIVMVDVVPVPHPEDVPWLRKIEEVRCHRRRGTWYRRVRGCRSRSGQSGVDIRGGLAVGSAYGCVKAEVSWHEGDGLQRDRASFAGQLISVVLQGVLLV